MANPERISPSLTLGCNPVGCGACRAPCSRRARSIATSLFKTERKPVFSGEIPFYFRKDEPIPDPLKEAVCPKCGGSKLISCSACGSGKLAA